MNEEMPTLQNAQPVQVPSPVSQSEMPKEKKGLVKALAFLEVGIIEVLFVGVVIVLLFGTLNYFNILRLSELFPNQLGWMPHKTNQKISNLPIPTPVANLNYSPNVFSYDVETAKTIFSQYIKDMLKPEFIPQSLDIKQGLSIDNRMEDNNKKQFGSYFINNQVTISINFHYKENTNTPNDFTIFIQPAKIDKTTVTLDSANSLVKSYFVNSYTPIENCNTKGTTSYCEKFKTEADGKKGYGVIFAYDQSVSPPKPTLIVFNCFVPKESKDYASQTSCISP